MQAYKPLQEDFELRLVGRRKGFYETNRLEVPTTLLPSIAAYPVLARGWRFAGRRTTRHLRDADFLYGLGRVARQASILHAAETAIPVSEQAAAICRSQDKRLVLTCWETIPFRFDDDPRLRQRKQVVKDVVSLYIAVTPRAKLALLEEGVAESKIQVVPAAVDCSRFSPDTGARDLRRQWNVADHQTVLLYVGRLIQEKGIVELVRAFAHTDDADSVLVVVGSGNQGERVLHAASALHIADRIRVVPGVSYSEVPSLYAAADIVVAPSLPTPYWEEQFGMVLVEAMASGKALITTSSGAIPEVVQDAALLAPPYDVQSLSSHLRLLITNSQARNELGRRARELVLSTYSVQAVAPQLAKCYRRVLAG